MKFKVVLNGDLDSNEGEIDVKTIDDLKALDEKYKAKLNGEYYGMIVDFEQETIFLMDTLPEG